MELKTGEGKRDNLGDSIGEEYVETLKEETGEHAEGFHSMEFEKQANPVKLYDKLLAYVI